MIALIIVIVLLTIAVIYLAIQRSKLRSRQEDETLSKRQLAELSAANERLSETRVALEQAHAANAQKDVELQQATERMVAEAERQIQQHKSRLELEFAERKRQDRAVSNLRSRGSLVAKVAEHMAPFLPGFQYNPKDARHFGEIFDFLVFDGMEEGKIREVVFLEIKTTTSNRTRRLTNPREKMLRDAIKNGRVSYRMWQPEVKELDELAHAPEIEGGETA